MATSPSSSPSGPSGPSGPVVLITGCTDGGIGHALALEFASKGCSVVATSRSLESMQALQGAPGIWLRALDVRSEPSIIVRTVDSVVGQFGRIDVLVNNAGLHLVAPLLEAPMDSFHTVFDTNVYGPIRLIQAVVPHMIHRRHGKIVNIGSVVALAPGPWAGVYSASKSALHALTDTLRLELRSFGISVTTVAPGAISSNLGNSSLQTYNKIADWKFYKEFESTIRARTDISQGPKSTPANVFAKKVVVSVLKTNPPRWFSYGRFSTILAILYYLPLCIRDYFYKLVFKC